MLIEFGKLGKFASAAGVSEKNSNEYNNSTINCCTVVS